MKCLQMAYKNTDVTGTHAIELLVCKETFAKTQPRHFRFQPFAFVTAYVKTITK